MSDTTTSTAESAGKDASPVRPPLISPSRIWSLATVTFTQLLRMKVLYFMLIFGLIVAVIFNFNPSGQTVAQQLKSTKDVSFAVMNVFSMLFAIASTAILIPKDLEDRTLYTILSKPVPRLDYLLGRLMGVLMVVGACLIIMYAFLALVLFVQEQILVSAELSRLREQPQMDSETLLNMENDMRKQGLHWPLLYAPLAIFLKACVVAAVTLFLSTFASSTLFTIIVSAMLFLIGHFHKSTYEVLMEDTHANAVVALLGKLVVLAVPNFALFNVVDGIAAAEPVDPMLMGQLFLVTAVYTVLYLLVALIVFMDKEF